MASESPLFQSSLELVGHSISHYNAADELDRKLVILHLANAVELILKDLALDAGSSIYKQGNTKETVSIHKAIESLVDAGIEIPQFNKMELLIDERNSLQHRFGSLNELTTTFYMNAALEFFKCVLTDNYGLDPDETLSQFTPSDQLALLGLKHSSDEDELDNLSKLAMVHPTGAMLALASHLERTLRDKLQEYDVDGYWLRRGVFLHLPRTLAAFGFELDQNMVQEFDSIRLLRNQTAHGRAEPSTPDVTSAIASAKKIVALIDGASLNSAPAPSGFRRPPKIAPKTKPSSSSKADPEASDDN